VAGVHSADLSPNPIFSGPAGRRLVLAVFHRHALAHVHALGHFHTFAHVHAHVHALAFAHAHVHGLSSPMFIPSILPAGTDAGWLCAGACATAAPRPTQTAKQLPNPHPHRESLCNPSYTDLMSIVGNIAGIAKGMSITFRRCWNLAG